MATGKNFAGWVPGPFVEAAERIVRDEYNNNTSEFVAALIEQRVKNGSAALKPAPDVLVQLAHHHHPTIEEDLAAALSAHKVHQPRAVVRLLDAALEAANRNVDLTRPIGIYSSEQQMIAFLSTQHGGREFIARIRALAESFQDVDAPEEIPNSPVAEVIRGHESRKEAQASRAAGRASHRQTASKRPGHTPPNE